MWNSRAMIILPALITSVLVGCSGGDPAVGTVDIGPDPVATTTLPAPAPASSPPTSVLGVPSPFTEVEAVPFSTPQYEVMARTPGVDGDTLIVLLDSGSYMTLSDIDLQNIDTEVYDRFPSVIEAHLVGDPAAATLAVIDGLTAVVDPDLSEHYMARLEDSFRIVFLGRFEEYGTTSLGS